MSQVKVGDRVKLVRLDEEAHERVERFLGKEGTVTDDHANSVFVFPLAVLFDGTDEEYCFNAGELEVLA